MPIRNLSLENFLISPDRLNEHLYRPKAAEKLGCLIANIKVICQMHQRALTSNIAEDMVERKDIIRMVQIHRALCGRMYIKGRIFSRTISEPTLERLRSQLFLNIVAPDF